MRSVTAHMRIALGQLNMVWEDKGLSLQKSEELIRQAAAGKAEEIFFPDMSLTGFSMNLDRIGERRAASESVAAMQKLAVKYGTAVGFGWAALPEPGDEKGTNRFTLVDRDGQVLGEYAKLHPFRYGGEADAYQGGNELVTVPFYGHVIGLYVCYDLRFPEIFQAASDRADLLVVIADWPASRRDHWLTLLRARAIENQAYVAGINCVGDLDGLNYSGDSTVFDPMGQMLGTLHGQEGLVVCDIGEDARTLREKFQMKSDRRNDLYIQQYEKIRKVQSL